MGRRHAAEWLFGEDEPSVVEITRAKGKAVVLLSDERRVRTSATALAIAGVEVGSAMDVRTRQRLIEAEEVAAAAKKGVRMLARTAKTAHEIRERLVARGVEEKVAERAVEHLRSHGLVDDAEIARGIVAKPTMSEAMARHVMEERGIGAAVAERVLRETARPSVMEAAKAVNGALPASLSLRARRQRLLAALAKRGFEADESVEAVEALLPMASED